jgi:hypothetical protein
LSLNEFLGVPFFNFKNKILILTLSYKFFEKEPRCGPAEKSLNPNFDFLKSQNGLSA